MTKNHSQRSGTCRNLAALTLLLIAFTVLITVVSFYNRELILIRPDDRVQIAAERADRENNAYYVLEHAQAILPERLETEGLPRDEQGKPVWHGSHSTTTRLRMPYDPDSPEMLAHLSASREAVELARTAIGRPFFRYPIPIPHGEKQNILPHNDSFNDLMVRWFSVADAQIRYWNEVDVGIASLHDL